jgi:hypothetical protein
MITYIKHTSKEKQPEKAGWYGTSKGDLFWFPHRAVWSCRDDRISDEFPGWWLEPTNEISIQRENNQYLYECLTKERDVKQALHEASVTQEIKFEALREAARAILAGDVGPIGLHKLEQALKESEQ